MNRVKRYLFYSCCLLVKISLSQQADSIINILPKQLSEIEITTNRLSTFSIGTKSETIDSATLARYSENNLAELLASESLIFIKSYGLGSSATSSFRGAGASHTAVLWNGFNIQSPMLGQLDLSLVPVNFVNDVKLQYGGAGALWGSGAVGGTIHLNNTPQFNKGLQLSLNASYGSFNNLQQQFLASFSNKKLFSSIKLFNHTATNDFEFINVAQYGKPLQKQQNAEVIQYGLLQENDVIINTRQKLNTRFWYQFNDRNIPPSMTQNYSNANQKDKLYRITSEWQRTGAVNLFSRVAFFNELLHFVDSAISENSTSVSNAFIAESEARFQIFKFDLLNVGVNNTYTTAKTPDYLTKVAQNRTALFFNYKIQNKATTWSVAVSARKEFIEAIQVPYTASLGIEGRLLKWFYIKANASKHYRLPSFNDLYWSGIGAKGNSNLKPESGWSEEFSLIHKYRLSHLSWDIGATAFNRTIDNWIIWLPNQTNTWMPENVLQVWSRGLEYKLNTIYTIKKFKLHVSAMYNYVLSTNESVVAYNSTSLKKQLIYVPIQNAQGSISIFYKNSSITYVHTYTGYRYTSSDNLNYLKPFDIANINIAQHFTTKKTDFKIYVQINNVFGKAYQVIAYRPMPLLNYQVGISINFNKSNNKN